MGKRENEKPTLNNSDDKRLKMLNKKFNVSTTEDIVNTKTFRQIVTVFEDNYKNVGTREVIMYSLKKFLLIKYWAGNRSVTIQSNKLLYDITEYCKNLTEAVAKAEDKQELRNNEVNTYKTLTELIQIRDSIQNTNSPNTANQKLLLQLTTMQPPLRNDFYASCKIATKKADLNSTDNFLYWDKRHNKMRYIVNHDKVTNRAQIYKTESYKNIDIIDPELKKILKDSFTNRPRTYLFENGSNCQYTNDTIYLMLLYRPFKLNFDVLRSAYVTDFYNKNDSYASRKELARMMRHDQMTAHQKYAKILPEEDDVTVENILKKLNEKERIFLQKLLVELI